MIEICSLSLWYFYLKNMPAINLNFIVVQTNSPMTMTVLDASVYPTTPPSVSGATIVIDVPGFEKVELPFTPNTYNTFNSTNLGITPLGKEIPLHDGIYTIRYYVDPEVSTFVEHSILRVDKLLEKYYSAFMTLDMMECDRAIKTQAFVQLNTIYIFIQGAVAAANNCASVESNKLYKQADNMLNTFIKGDCGCSGSNYVINLKY
jgi:hypothetical protein